METSLTELCQELKNWFVRRTYTGTIELADDGKVYCNGNLVQLLYGQYYRVKGSVFSDGIHKYPEPPLVDATHEIFSGTVWTMAVPKPVLVLAKDISDWRAKYESVESAAMSPFTSEQVPNYSYSKSSNNNSSSGENGGVSGWKSVFASRMNAWRKI